ncbi:MAG: hypothetical protein RL753_106, partial [Bacteroidota bacterium]
MTRTEATALLKSEAKRLGFIEARVARADFLTDDAPRLEEWLKGGMHGSMRYMENHFDKRLDPRKLVPGAKSVVSLAFNYYPEPSELEGDDRPRVARYAYGEDYQSFVNGQFTPQGGTHQAAFREAYVKVIRDFFGKEFDASDVRGGIVAAVSVRVEEPVFESQTKTKLGSMEVGPGRASLKSFVYDFLKRELDNFLHRNPEVATSLQQRILQSERERKDLAGIRKLARERAKKAAVHNR